MQICPAEIVKHLPALAYLLSARLLSCRNLSGYFLSRVWRVALVPCLLYPHVPLPPQCSHSTRGNGADSLPYRSADQGTTHHAAPRRVPHPVHTAGGLGTGSRHCHVRCSHAAGGSSLQDAGHDAQVGGGGTDCLSLPPSCPLLRALAPLLAPPLIFRTVQTRALWVWRGASVHVSHRQDRHGPESSFARCYYPSASNSDQVLGSFVCCFAE